MSEPAPPSLDAALARPERGARSIVDAALGIDRDHPQAAPVITPRPLGQRLIRSVTNRPVKVPAPDWEKIVVGTKRMFRTYARGWRDRHARLFPEGEEFPRPALIYCQPGHPKVYDFRLAVITGYRQEPLGAISAEDLSAEGFRTIRHFRLYWKRRYARWGWRPHDMISVVELRPWNGHDDIEQAAWALERLFGEWR